MILDVDLGSAVPPYEQIRAQITAMARAGILPAGRRLPTIRQLAADLGVSSGTVARAYRELERDRIVVARGRHGTTIGDGLASGAERRDLLTSAMQLARAAKRSGTSLEVALDTVRAAWSMDGARP